MQPSTPFSFCFLIVDMMVHHTLRSISKGTGSFGRGAHARHNIAGDAGQAARLHSAGGETHGVLSVFCDPDMPLELQCARPRWRWLIFHVACPGPDVARPYEGLCAVAGVP